MEGFSGGGVSKHPLRPI